MRPELGAMLERLYREIDAGARLQADPVRYPHRYTDARDQEVAALVASSLAYGRVAAFSAVLDRLFAAADARGGPYAFVTSFDAGRDKAPLLELTYRFNRGVDFVLLALALRELYAGQPSLERYLVGRTLPEALTRLVASIRQAAVLRASEAGLSARDFSELPRGFRTLLPSPEDGSATKRWWMFLRWMVRPTREGIDLGLWRSFAPSALVVPLDTHVLKISRLTGLTRRKDGSLETAIDITRALTRFDPDDPVRFDFAIAHLGISGRCKGTYRADICPECPLQAGCTEGSAR